MSFLKNLFGGGGPKAPNLGPAPQINFSPAGFSGSGGSASFAGGQYGFTPSAASTSAIGNLASTFGQQAGALGQLRQSVAPGFSQFRQAGLRDLSNQQRATTSNLRDNLAQRRILGSSFAQDSLGRTNAEFEKQRTDFIAQSYLQEVATSQQLIQQQYQAAAQQYTVGINQMNFETGIAAHLTSQATSASAAVAEAQARIDQTQSMNQATMQFNYDKMGADASAGMGKLAGSLLTAPGSSAFGQGASSLGSSASSFFGSLFGGSTAAGGTEAAIAAELPDLAMMAVV